MYFTTILKKQQKVNSSLRYNLTLFQLTNIKIRRNKNLYVLEGSMTCSVVFRDSSEDKQKIKTNKQMNRSLTELK